MHVLRIRSLTSFEKTALMDAAVQIVEKYVSLDNLVHSHVPPTKSVKETFGKITSVHLIKNLINTEKLALMDVVVQIVEKYASLENLVHSHVPPTKSAKETFGKITHVHLINGLINILRNASRDVVKITADVRNVVTAKLEYSLVLLTKFVNSEIGNRTLVRRTSDSMNDLRLVLVDVVVTTVVRQNVAMEKWAILVAPNIKFVRTGTGKNTLVLLIKNLTKFVRLA